MSATVAMTATGLLQRVCCVAAVVALTAVAALKAGTAPHATKERTTRGRVCRQIGLANHHWRWTRTGLLVALQEPTTQVQRQR